MNYKELNLDETGYEKILYKENSLPISTCIDELDDYFNKEWQYHWHEELEFVTVYNGKVEVSIYTTNETFKIVLNKGEGIFINSNYLHSIKALESKTILQGVVFPIVFFNRIFIDIYYERFKNMTYVPFVTFKNTEYQNTFCEDISALCTTKEDSLSATFNIMEIVCRLCRIISEKQTELCNFEELKYTQKMNNLKTSLNYIFENYHEDIKVEKIANSINVSRSECFRLFKDILGKTPLQFVNDYRISIASSLLRKNNDTLETIAFNCGFSSTSYFCKVFKKKQGLTPSEYKEMYQLNT
ncbi:hypothetical protein CPU09_13875 [Mammaliicoccus sciuri]|uniref:AraC family transcriptional regulator n=1 Tax=Mammaliicoccus sciuri TaxID=1296 RepID=UPI000BBE4353|nr:helix-turn-helix domain-containing protein [Mammaliicoccus sciuri]PCM39967.1 hypothetical protein CPU09_13875 [Mammaliicoccus sciuri]